MAFTIQNWNRSSSSANEPIVTLASGIIQGCFRTYDYYSPVTDTQVTISTASYFDDVNYDLTTGDYIKAYSVNDAAMVRYRATNTAGVITVAIAETGTIEVSTAITAAEFNALYGASLVILPAPGADRLYLLESVTMRMTFATLQYAAGGAVNVQYNNTVNAGGVICSTTVSAASINALTGDGVFTFAPISAAAGLDATMINQGLYLSCATQLFTTGDSTFVCTARAKIISTA